MKVPQILNEIMKDNFKCILLIGEQIESVVIKDCENVIIEDIGDKKLQKNPPTDDNYSDDNDK